MNEKESWYAAGLLLLQRFCEINRIPAPIVRRLAPTDRLYHLATCAYYRADQGISIMVEKCAQLGRGGPAWSWPGYAVDRTPYGVLQHELAHHVDEVLSTKPLRQKSDLFAYRIYQQSLEEPLTGYLGTDREAQTFFKEWFAENFRLFVTNPDLSKKLRPKFFKAVSNAGLRSPLATTWGEAPSWHHILRSCSNAPARIILQAEKKIAAAEKTTAEQQFQQQYLGVFAESSPANTEGNR